MQKINARALVLGGMFASLVILLTYVFSIKITFVHITFGFLPLALYASMYGPWKAGMVGAVANLIGSTMFYPDIFFPGFVLSDFLKGWIYGYFFHKKKELSWRNTWQPFLLVTLLIHLGLNTLWLVILYDKAAEVIFMSRLVKNIICYPMEVSLFLVFYKSLYIFILKGKVV